MFESLNRKELQALAKSHGIKANGKTVDIIAELERVLPQKESLVDSTQMSDCASASTSPAPAPVEKEEVETAPSPVALIPLVASPEKRVTSSLPLVQAAVEEDITTSPQVREATKRVEVFKSQSPVLTAFASPKPQIRQPLKRTPRQNGIEGDVIVEPKTKIEYKQVLNTNGKKARIESPVATSFASSSTLPMAVAPLVVPSVVPSYHKEEVQEPQKNESEDDHEDGDEMEVEEVNEISDITESSIGSDEAEADLPQETAKNVECIGIMPVEPAKKVSGFSSTTRQKRAEILQTHRSTISTGTTSTHDIHGRLNTTATLSPTQSNDVNLVSSKRAKITVPSLRPCSFVVSKSKKPSTVPHVFNITASGHQNSSKAVGKQEQQQHSNTATSAFIASGDAENQHVDGGNGGELGQTVKKRCPSRLDQRIPVKQTKSSKLREDRIKSHKNNQKAQRDSKISKLRG